MYSETLRATNLLIIKKVLLFLQ